MKILIFACLLCFCGCLHVPDLKKGQAFIHETQVEGIDISIPIPMLENVNIVNLRFGFIQHKSYKGYNVKYTSGSEYKDISIITGTGTINRLFEVDYE